MQAGWFATGAGFGALAVILGAFGAHTLKATVEPRMLEVFETGARYQMYHALALLAVSHAATRWPGSLTQASGYLFVLGILLFSGSLYAMTLTGIKSLGAITPIGGLCFITGWICLALTAIRNTGTTTTP